MTVAFLEPLLVENTLQMSCMHQHIEAVQVASHMYMYMYVPVDRRPCDSCDVMSLPRNSLAFGVGLIIIIVQWAVFMFSAVASVCHAINHST